MSLWLAENPLVLASKSMSRQNLLRAAGIPFDVKPADIDERAAEERAALHKADAVALFLAEQKAAAVARKMPERYVLGADQTLFMKGRRFSKPASLADAKDQLAALSGHTHHLYSAIAVMRGDKLVFHAVAEARLTMRPLSEAFIGDYCAEAGEAILSSVGGYQVEGLGIHLFSRIEGEHSVILGLPLVSLLEGLREEGLLAR